MIECELCGKEFKTGQGLSGHMKFVHGVSGGSGKPVTQLVTSEQLQQLGEQLRQLEGDTEQLGEQVSSYTHQLSNHTQQLNNHTQQLQQLNGYPKQANEGTEQLNRLTRASDNLVKQVNAITERTELLAGDILVIKGRLDQADNPGEDLCPKCSQPMNDHKCAAGSIFKTVCPG